MSLADCSRRITITIAVRLPASSLPANSHDLRPRNQGRMRFSMCLLSTLTAPSPRNRPSAPQRFRLSSSAAAMPPPSGTRRLLPRPVGQLGKLITAPASAAAGPASTCTPASPAAVRPGRTDCRSWPQRRQCSNHAIGSSQGKTVVRRTTPGLGHLLHLRMTTRFPAVPPRCTGA